MDITNVYQCGVRYHIPLGLRYSAADDTTEDESDEGSGIDILDTYRPTSTMINLLNDPDFLVYTPNLKSIINSAKNGSVPVASKILEDDICGPLSFTF